MPSNRTGSPVSMPNGTMSSISKSIASPDAHAVAQAVVGHLDPRPLDAEHLADQRRQPGHRASELPAEDLYELVGLLVVACSSMNIPSRQLPSVIIFGVSMITTR